MPGHWNCCFLVHSPSLELQTMCKLCLRKDKERSIWGRSFFQPSFISLFYFLLAILVSFLSLSFLSTPLSTPLTCSKKHQENKSSLKHATLWAIPRIRKIVLLSTEQTLNTKPQFRTQRRLLQYPNRIRNQYHSEPCHFICLSLSSSHGKGSR